MNKLLIRILIVALIPTLAPLAAAADDAASPPDSLAPSACTQPPLPTAPGVDNTASRIKKSNDDFKTQFQAYRECMKIYVDNQSELSKKHIAAANAAVKEVNDYNQKVNDALGK